MFAATRRWVKRNRTPFAVAVGVVGVGYVATQYVLNKISEARERMSSDRIAREKYTIPAQAPYFIILILSQSAETLRTKSRRLHIHSTRLTTDSHREYYRCAGNGENHFRIATTEGG